MRRAILARNLGAHFGARGPSPLTRPAPLPPFRYGTSDEGCTIGQVAQATAASGISAEQVRAAVEYLAGEGHLYSTIDDEHYKSTGS